MGIWGASIRFVYRRVHGKLQLQGKEHRRYHLSKPDGYGGYWAVCGSTRVYLVGVLKPDVPTCKLCKKRLEKTLAGAQKMISR